MYQGCVFDMDGTIADTLASIAYFGNTALAALRLPPLPRENYRQYVGNGADRLMRRMLRASGVSEDEKTVSALRAAYDGLYEKDPLYLVEPYPGIPDMLQELRRKQVKLAVLSNKPHDMTHFIAQKLFPDIFDTVCGQREGVPVKPDHRSLLDILQGWSCPKQEILYIGDSGVDLQTGKNAAVDTAGVLWGFRDEEELRGIGAAFYAESPEKLLSFIRNGSAAAIKP